MTSRTPPPSSVAFLLSLVLLASTACSMLWFHGATALGVPPRLVQRGTFLAVELFGILLPALACAKLLELDWRATFPARPPRAGAAFAAIAATLGLATLLTYFQEIYQDAFNLPYPAALMEVLVINGWAEGVLLLLGVVLGAAICEEAVFRGYCQSSLRNWLGFWPALVLTTLAFAAFHLEPAGLPTYLLLGAWLGWLRELGGSLWLPIAAHATNNLLAVLQANVLPEAFWLAHAAMIVPGGLALALLGIYGLKRALRSGR